MTGEAQAVTGGSGPAAGDVPLAMACRADLDRDRARLVAMLPGGGPGERLQAGRDDQAAGCEVLSWARSGLMHLTGPAHGAPLAPPGPVLARAGLILDLIAHLAGARSQLDLSNLLTGRAREAGYQRRGRASANGSCRLLAAADGWVAVNLARSADVCSLSAVLGRELRGEPWDELAEHAASSPAGELAAAAQLVGIPAAVLGQDAPEPMQLSRPGRPADPADPADRLVLDLSAMWAGPLCARILADAGWRVLEVEDSRRPDGARRGPPAFYAALHAGIPAVRLDFGSAAGRAELGRLAARAAIVIESSRPRALRALGLVARDWLAARPGRVWVSITGYGREDRAQRVAFGDDAAAAGGLAASAADGTPAFCGDAIADPLTGLAAGLAALACAADGGGWLADVAMAGVCAELARPAGTAGQAHAVTATAVGWIVRHGECRQAVRGW
jgi:hypothetical protein